MEGFATVEEALEELRNGKLILVTDDEDRENEGDFICAAEFATTENINFMAFAVFLECGNGNHFYIVPFCKCKQFRCAHHGAILAHDLTAEPTFF